MANYLWDVGPRINADMVAIGRKPRHAQNFVNQIMTGAKLIEQTESCRVFTDAKGKYRMEAHKTHNSIERLVTANDARDALAAKEGAEFYGQYAVTFHARERFKERFDASKTDTSIDAHLNNILRSATLQSVSKGKQGDEMHVYNAERHNMRLVISKATETIITVHQLVAETKAAPIIEKDSPLFGAIIAATKRELGKARRAFRKTNRELTEQLAAIQIEMAHAMVNKTRAKGEHIVSAVERKMNELAEQERAIVARLDAEQAKFERVEADAGKVIGGGR